MTHTDTPPPDDAERDGRNEHDDDRCREHDRAAGGSSDPACPLCALMAAVGELDPEVRTHLQAAGRELLMALRAALGTFTKEPEPPSERGLRRIDLDGA